MKTKEELRAYQNAWRRNKLRTDSIYRERVRAQKRASNARCAATVAAGKQRYYQQNKERLMVKFRAYYAANKHLWEGAWGKKTYAQRRFEHALTKAVSKNAEVVDVDSIREFYRQVYSKKTGVCEYCRGRFGVADITIDHKQPYKLGGKHEVSNLAVSCLLCNLKKGIKPYETWTALLT